MDIERLGKYEVSGTLGKGAMGTVYAGWDPIISRKVAIKTVRLPDAADIDAQEELNRFKREAQAAGRLTHPNIVGVFDYGETDQVAFIVMEFVDGTTLKALIDAGERMAVPQVGRVMADVLAGLSYSHERGVIHRDIKPANIMIVGGDGRGSGQAKIADFGIARIESSNMTQAGTIMGTPAYMSPEQFMGQTVDARTDIYSSGVLLFQLLTGERPFEGSMATIMHKALNTQPPKPSELSVTAPVALDGVVARAMAKRPEERFATAGEFADALQAALTAPAAAGTGLSAGLGDLMGDDSEATLIATSPRRPEAARASPASPAAARPARSRTTLLASAGLVVLAAVAGGAYFALSPAGPVPAPRDVAAATPAPAPLARVEPPTGPLSPSALGPAAAPPEPASAPHAAAAPPTPDPVVTQVVPPRVAQVAPAKSMGGQSLPPAVPAETAPPQAARIVPPAAASGSPGALPGPISSSAAPTAAPAPLPPADVPISTPVPPAPAPTQLAAVVTPEAMRRAVATAIAGVECAAVSGEAGPGGVALTGAVGQGRPQQELYRAVEDAAGGALVGSARLGVVDGPYCGVLNAVRGHARPFGAATPTLQIGTKDGRTEYQADDRVELRSAMPDFSAYLQLDYFQSDGTVSHLLKSAPGAPVLLAGTVKDVVAGDVGAPFGTDLVVGIASSVALYSKEAKLSETTEGYVRELRTALEAAARRGARVSVSVLGLKTAPRK